MTDELGAGCAAADHPTITICRWRRDGARPRLVRGATDPHVVVDAGALQHHELAWAAVQSMNMVRRHRWHGAALAGVQYIGVSWRARLHYHRAFQADK